MNTLIARTLILLIVTAAALHAQDCWQERASGSAPGSRSGPTAVWTGSEMIVWGGQGLNDGGRYNPAGNSWTPVSATGAPAGRQGHTAVWTGSEMIVWGGYNSNNGSYLNEGGRYNPATNSWTAVSTIGAPTARYNHTAVWTGSEMIVWGGYNGTVGVDTGERYNPATNSWTAVNITGAPAARRLHTAVWTGSEMIVWGGTGNSSSLLNTGGRYNPAGNSWSAVSTAGAPAERYRHTAVWTGSEMIVWGGTSDFLGSVSTNTGGRYNPVGNSWTAVSTAAAPSPRQSHTATWTGSEIIVWGGSTDRDGDTYLNTGARYHPAGNNWTAVTTTGAPSARSFHTAVWTGSEMIVWGGAPVSSNDTFSYIPDCGPFRIICAIPDNGNLVLSFPSVTGRTYTLWRSDTLGDGSWANTGLPAVAGTGAILTFTVSAPTVGVLKRFFRVQADSLLLNSGIRSAAMETSGTSTSTARQPASPKTSGQLSVTLSDGSQHSVWIQIK